MENTKFVSKIQFIPYYTIQKNNLHFRLYILECNLYCKLHHLKYKFVFKIVKFITDNFDTFVSMGVGRNHTGLRRNHLINDIMLNLC